MRSRALEQLSSKKSLIDKIYQDIAAHKHDVQLLQKQTEDVQKHQETLNEYLKARPTPTASPPVLTSGSGVQEDELAGSTQPLHSDQTAREIAGGRPAGRGS
jgi:hypothetical protein